MKHRTLGCGHIVVAIVHVVLAKLMPQHVKRMMNDRLAVGVPARGLTRPPATRNLHLMNRAVLIRQATKEGDSAVCELFAEADALHADAAPRMFRHTNAPARSRSLFDRYLTDPALLALNGPKNPRSLAADLADSEPTSQSGCSTTTTPIGTAHLQNPVPP